MTKGFKIYTDSHSFEIFTKYVHKYVSALNFQMNILLILNYSPWYLTGALPSPVLKF